LPAALRFRRGHQNALSRRPETCQGWRFSALFAVGSSRSDRRRATPYQQADGLSDGTPPVAWMGIRSWRCRRWRSAPPGLAKRRASGVTPAGSTCWRPLQVAKAPKAAWPFSVSWRAEPPSPVPGIASAGRQKHKSGSLKKHTLMRKPPPHNRASHQIYFANNHVGRFGYCCRWRARLRPHGRRATRRAALPGSHRDRPRRGGPQRRVFANKRDPAGREALTS